MPSLVGGLQFRHAGPPVGGKVGVDDLRRPGQQAGHAGDGRLEVAGVHVGLPCCGVLEGFDQELDTGIIGAARPLETNDARFGAGSGGEVLDQARELLGVLGPDQMPHDDEDHG
jgi:hypothetical protein